MRRFIFLSTVLLQFFALNLCAQNVFVTKTGTKYHVESCGYLRSSSIPIELSKALENGYTACSVCKPPSKPNGSKTPPAQYSEQADLKVYVTKSGTKYHTIACRYTSDSSIATTESEAKKQGYSPCSVCNPAKVEEQKNSPLSSSQSGQAVQCSAITKAGTRCQRTTKSSNGKCWQHGGS